MFTTRLVTATVLLSLVVGAAVLLPNQYWAVLLLPGLWVAALEWAALAGFGRAGKWIFGGVVLLSGVAFCVSDQPVGLMASAPVDLRILASWVSAAFWLLLAPVWLIAKWGTRNAPVMVVAGCAVLLPAWLALVTLQTEAVRLLMLLGVVWIADTAAYAVGSCLGRRRFAPQISPRKTWEGVIGACIAVAVYYALLWLVFAPRQPLLQGPGGAVLFAIVTLMGVEGDLFESWMKRQAGVKDSGGLFPGHGGMLDRIDGLITSMPLAVLWLHYFG